MLNGHQFGKAGCRISDRVCVAQTEILPTLARPGLFGD
jgi:hypothetical protein